MKKLKFLSIPYFVWMLILVVLPSILVFLVAFSDLNIFNLGSFSLNFDSITYITENETVREIILQATWNSIRLSFVATLLCLLIGYPIAYFLANLESEWKNFIVVLIILPIWSNMLLRIMAWEKVLFSLGDYLSTNLGTDISIIGTDTGILIGMVSMYLPFMILPIYTILDKMDKSLVEASHDLGANSFVTFYKVIFPLSLSGVVSGVIMTLLPAMTAFALPQRLGGGKINLLGNMIEHYFMESTGNLNVGSFLSIALMVVIIMMFVGLLKFDKEGETLM
jgi:spermidine/putrescine transport system permease protein